MIRPGSYEVPSGPFLVALSVRRRTVQEEAKRARAARRRRAARAKRVRQVIRRWCWWAA